MLLWAASWGRLAVVETGTRHSPLLLRSDLSSPKIPCPSHAFSLLQRSLNNSIAMSNSSFLPVDEEKL